MIYIDSNGALRPLYLTEENGIQTIITVPPKIGTPYWMILDGCRFNIGVSWFTIINPYNHQGAFQQEHIYYFNISPSRSVDCYVHDFIDKSNQLWDKFDTANMPFHDNGSLINTTPQSVFASGNAFPYVVGTGVVQNIVAGQPISFSSLTEDQLYIELKEPECKCKYLMDGHDSGCEYFKWKRSFKSVS